MTEYTHVLSCCRSEAEHLQHQEATKKQLVLERRGWIPVPGKRPRVCKCGHEHTQRGREPLRDTMNRLTWNFCDNMDCLCMTLRRVR